MINFPDDSVDSMNNSSASAYSETEEEQSPPSPEQLEKAVTRIDEMFAVHNNNATMLSLKCALIKLAQEGLLNE